MEKFLLVNLQQCLDNRGGILRCMGPMVSTLDSGSRVLWSSPFQDHYVVFLGKTITLTVPPTPHPGVNGLSANLTLGGNPARD